MYDTSYDGQIQDDWGAVYRRQQEEDERRKEVARAEQMASIVNDNRAVFDNYVKMQSREMQDRRNANRRGAAHLLSAFKMGAYAPSGTAPAVMLPGLNDALGFNREAADGTSRRISSVNLSPAGDMVLGIMRRDKQGNESEDAPVAFPFSKIYGIALENPGVLTRDELMRLRDNSITTRKLTEDMANRDLPMVPDDYGTARIPPGERTPDGGVSVGSLFSDPRRRYGASISSADGKGGFSRTEIGADGTVTREDSGTRDPNYKGRWKVLSSGSHAQGRGTRYENDKTGEVVFVPEGQTIESVTRGASDKERVAQINAYGKIRAAEQANETKMSLAEAANELKRYGIDVSAQLKDRGLDIQQQNADERATHNRATETQQSENEKGRNERAKQANEMKTKLAEMKGGGTIGGRQPTAHEYVEVMKLAGDVLQSEETRAQAKELGSIIADSLKKRGEKVPSVSQGGKDEAKTGDNGGDGEKRGANDDGLPDDSESRMYPGFKVATVKKALANGYVYDEGKGEFVKQKR